MSNTNEHRRPQNHGGRRLIQEPQKEDSRRTMPQRRTKKRPVGATIAIRFFQVLGTLILIGIVTGAFMACYAMVYVKTVIMPKTDLDLSAYTHVTVCAPIWVFALAAPVRAFCRQAAGQIREADYLLVHHTGGVYTNAAEEMDALLGITHTGLRSVRCRMGPFKTIR